MDCRQLRPISFGSQEINRVRPIQKLLKRTTILPISSPVSPSCNHSTTSSSHSLPEFYLKVRSDSNQPIIFSIISTLDTSIMQRSSPIFPQTISSNFVPSLMNNPSSSSTTYLLQTPPSVVRHSPAASLVISIRLSLNRVQISKSRILPVRMVI